MSKKLCKSKKSRTTNEKNLALGILMETHTCRKCGRVADSKKLLCKPRKLG